MTPVSAYFASNQHNSRGLDMLDTLLIANRGEIACRIATTAKRLGIRTVAIYSDGDSQSRHVDICDVAVYVGGSEARESYLQIEKIIAAAQKTVAQAIHPGYGFLAENEAFANACKDAGILFVGPPAQAISAMGDKSAAKSLMKAAGVPLVPGYHGDNQETEFLKQQADEIGRSEEHTSELQSRGHLVCRLLLEK